MLNYRSMMDDPESGRCRRTDGKKWRCKTSVILHQKYCERHMHRGCRERSRKLVEYSENKDRSLTSATTQTPSSKNRVVKPKNVVEYKENVTQTQTQEQRCKRTDGKKWQCSKTVIHGQKYCETHMHRGVKKVISSTHFHETKKVFDDRVDLNNDLATSVVVMEHDSTTRIMISSDATTITN